METNARAEWKAGCREFAEALPGSFDGELRGDDKHRHLYAQDASIYEEQPLGVAYPEHAADVEALVEAAAETGTSLIPRAGGTSLAGQCVGDGLVVDVGREMNEILEVDEEARQVRVQPGITLGDLNRALADVGLMFGPDTSTADQCQIGGMIGNNSCGSHSVYYGTTRDNIVSIEAVTSDGERHRFGEWESDEYAEKKEGDNRLAEALRTLEDECDDHADLIREKYPHPEMIRRNTGYPLDVMLERAPFAEEHGASVQDDEDSRPFSLAPFLCGTEGTLAITTEATLSLEPVPEYNMLVCAHFESLQAALEATVRVVDSDRGHDPAAVELMDRRILKLTEDHLEQRKNRFFVQGDPDAILAIEVYGDSRKSCEKQAGAIVDELKGAGLGFAFPVVHPPRDARVWALRKAGLGLLMGIEGDRKPVTVVEDTAVRPERLPEYIEEFSEIMTQYGTQCVHYAHASVGELHLRPELNLKEEDDAQRFEEIARDVTELVRRYQGALSGEHGDGRVRSPLLREFYGDKLMEVHERVKASFDPDGLFNPGKIVDPEPIDSNWRMTPGESSTEVETSFDWSDDQGLLRAVEKCNGAGVCRKTESAGGTMCPSYMATRDEEHTTRGRANLFRQLLRTEEPTEAFESEDLNEALDLCLSCKACKNECPASVDMARMKAEFRQQYHDRHGLPWSSWVFGRFRLLARLATVWAGLANFFASFALTRWVINKVGGIAPERTLPTFAGETGSAWMEKRGPDVDEWEAPVVWLYVDPFSNFTDTEVVRDAVRVIEAAGYRVEQLPIDDDGRTMLSKGMVDEAKRLTRENLERLEELFETYPDRKVIGLEPSALLTFRDEAVDLVEEEKLKSVARDLADRSQLFGEFVEVAELNGEFDDAWEVEDREVLLHGHCHQKALVGNEPTEHALELAGYEVETVDSGCCGMAGSFGYEAEHYELSMEIGGQRLFPAVRETERQTTLVCAPGTSCRQQIADGTEREAHHTATLLARALPDGEA